MRIKAITALMATAALLLAALGWLTLRCGQEGYGHLLLARAQEGARITPQQVEDFCADEFLITYELAAPGMAEAHGYRLPVTLMGTNSCYAQVLGYRMLSGGFFTQADWQGGARRVTLNATAAWQLFGSYELTGQTLRLDGQTWLISGVIEDGDTENPRLYAPSSVTGGQIGDVLALLDDSAVSAGYAQNALKKLGVYEHNYTIINLAAVASAFSQRGGVAARTALILLTALLWGAGWRFLGRRLPRYREQSRQMYTAELIISGRGDIAKDAAVALAMLAGLAVILSLALQILAIALKWPGLLPTGHEWALGSFANKLVWLHAWQPWGLAIFTLFMPVLAAIAAISLTRPRSRTVRTSEE